MSGKSAFRLNVLFGLLAAAVVIGWLVYQAQHQNADSSARDYEQQSLTNGSNPSEAPGGPFALVDQDGKTVTEKTYSGKFLLVTFGYTYCPDVCPTRLQDMALALDRLGDDAKLVQPLFISIDPQRDTPSQLKNYVSLYHNNIQGLTGTPKQIADVAHSFKIYYKRGEDVGDGNYMMDHSSSIFLLDPEAKVLDVFDDNTGADGLAQGLQRLLHR